MTIINEWKEFFPQLEENYQAGKKENSADYLYSRWQEIEQQIAADQELKKLCQIREEVRKQILARKEWYNSPEFQAKINEKAKCSLPAIPRLEKKPGQEEFNQLVEHFQTTEIKITKREWELGIEEKRIIIEELRKQVFGKGFKQPSSELRMEI